MIEKIDRKRLKRTAREKLRTATPSPLVVTLVFLLLTTGVSLLVDFVVANPAAMLGRIVNAATLGYSAEEFMAVVTAGGGGQTVMVLFLRVLTMLYTAVLSYGYYAYTLRRTRGEKAGSGDLLCGFGAVGRVIVMHLVVTGFTLVWTMAVIFPITTIGTMLTLLLMSISDALAIVGLALLYLLCIAGMVLVSYFTLRYAFAPFLLADDPALGGLDAVRQSRALLRGHAKEIFVLTLSFLGWKVLAVLASAVLIAAAVGMLFAGYAATGSITLLTVGAYGTVILGTVVTMAVNLWITPYLQGAMAEYYCVLNRKPPQAEL